MVEPSEVCIDMDAQTGNDEPDVMDFLRDMMTRLNQNSARVNTALCEVKNVVRHGLAEVREEARRHTDDVCGALKEEITTLQLAVREQAIAINELQH